MASGSVDYTLNKRHLPRSQVESIPIVDDGYSDDETSSINPSSLRSNFIPPGVPLPDVNESTMDRYGSYRSQSPYFSPVFSHLPAMKPQLLTVASQEAQQLRRKLMRDANVLIIQGGYLGKKFIYERLRELGVNVYMMDGPDTVWKTIANQGLLADFIELDFTDTDTIFERAMEAVADLHPEVQFDAVTTYFEDAVALAARIATALGVATNPVEACDKARNKRRTREVMADAGLPVPKFNKILREEDVGPACDYVGFPIILKPVYGAASMGVTKANNKEEAIEAYHKISKTLNVSEDPIWAQGTEMVIEEYYDGDEFDIDILLSEGKVVYAKVSDNWACWEPWFQETGTNCPSIYDPERQKELIKLSVDSTLALGFASGCFHVECRYTGRGPRLIEVNARMGGVSVRDANLIAWGVDLVEEHCMSALKIPIRPVIPAKPLRYMAESAINTPYSGTVNNDTWLDFVKDNPLVLRINYMKKKGEKVAGPEDGVPDWLAEIIVVSDVSQEEGMTLIKKAIIEKAIVPVTAKRPGSERKFFFPHHAHPFV